MRVRLVILATLIGLGAAFAAPGSAAAASPYSYVIVRNYCSGGQPNITIKIIKPAGYFPDRFTMDAQGQHRDVGFTRWWKEGASAHFQSVVPNQYSKWSWKKAIYWNPPDNEWHRIKVKLRVWSGGSVIAQKVVYSVAC